MKLRNLFLLALCSAGCASTTASPSAAFDSAEAQIELGKGDESANVTFDGSLDGYVDHALRNRPELQAKLSRWRAARYRVSAVDELGPLTLSYMFFIRRVETRVGPQRHRAGIKQMFPWPGKANAEAAVRDARVDVEEQRFSAELVDLRWQVVDSYWQQWRLVQELDLLGQHAEIVKAIGSAARSRVEIGAAQLSDVGQTELLLSRTKDGVEEARENLRRASIELSRAVGIGFRDDLPVETSVPEPRQPSEPIEQLVESAKQHPRISAIHEMRDVANRQIDKAAQGRRPNLGVGLDWIETGPALDPSMPDSGKDPVMAGVTLQLPLWSGETRAAADAARAEAVAFEADELAAARNAEAAVHKTVASLRDTARRIRLYETTLLPQAEAVLGSVRGSYEVGKTGIAALMMAQDELLSLRLKLAMVRAKHERQWAALERIVGRPVDTEVYQ